MKPILFSQSTLEELQSLARIRTILAVDLIGKLQDVHEILCFFPRILESLPPLPRERSAAVGCTKKYQPIGVTVRSHCVESFVGLLQ